MATTAESSAPAQSGPTPHSGHLPLARSLFGISPTGRNFVAQSRTRIGSVPENPLQGLHLVTTRLCTARPTWPYASLGHLPLARSQFDTPPAGRTCVAQARTRTGSIPRAPASGPAPGDYPPVHSPLWHSRPRALRQPILDLRFTRPLAPCTQPVRYTASGPNLRRSSADSDRIRPRAPASGPAAGNNCPCTARLAYAVESFAPALPGPTLHSITCPSTQPARIAVYRPGLRCSKLLTRTGPASTGSTPRAVLELQHGIQP
jgi:hypothetical protein